MTTTAAASAGRRCVSVITMGRMGFMPAYDVQMRYANQHLDELAGKVNAEGQNTLLLVEHTPVYTVGIRTKDYTDEDVSRLKETGAEFYKTNRGGLITFHGPGQLVAYPIINLQHFKPSMKWYVGQLETTMIATLRHFGLKGRLTDQNGVWVGDRKIGSIGLHGTRYVTTHGISLNCNTDLTWFRHIQPCGLKGVEMTSISREVDQVVPYSSVITPFLRAFQEVFECEMEFRLLDELELNSLTASSPTPLPSLPTEEGEKSATPKANASANTRLDQQQQQQRVEVVRHMSTSTFPLSQSSPSISTVLPTPFEILMNGKKVPNPMW